MLSYQYAPLVISFLLAMVGALTIFLASRSKTSKEKITDDFLIQLQLATGVDYSSIKITHTKNLISRWNFYWGNRLKQAGLVSTSKSDTVIGRTILVIFVSVYLFLTLIFQNAGIGIIPVALIFGILQGKINTSIKKKNEIFEQQIPSFLSILKSNIQSGDPPDNALIKAIDNIDDPLYSELVWAKHKTQAGSFQNAIKELRERTSNDTLRFLCGCIELSVKVGSNLEDQITTIEEMLESKSAIKRKLAVAANENTPLVYVMSIIIPGLFLFKYLFSEEDRAYWFKVPSSWFVFILALSALVLGIFLANRKIKKTGEF